MFVLVFARYNLFAVIGIEYEINASSLHILDVDASLCFSIGENIKLLIDRPDGPYCFRLHKDRIYYVR